MASRHVCDTRSKRIAVQEALVIGLECRTGFQSGFFRGRGNRDLRRGKSTRVG